MFIINSRSCSSCYFAYCRFPKPCHLCKSFLRYSFFVNQVFKSNLNTISHFSSIPLFTIYAISQFINCINVPQYHNNDMLLFCQRLHNQKPKEGEQWQVPVKQCNVSPAIVTLFAHPYFLYATSRTFFLCFSSSQNEKDRQRWRFFCAFAVLLLRIIVM